MNIFDRFKNNKTSVKSSAEQAVDIYRPKPDWASHLTDEEWNLATEGLPKGRVRCKFFASKDLPF